MDKTISITIAGLIFHVEETAYLRLEAYLSAIRNHFRAYDDSEEITRDIENRIAEIFTQRTHTTKQAVTAADVDEVIRQIGTVEDFEDFEGAAKKGPEDAEDGSSTTPKRLFRDPDNSILGGVASGVAAYLGIDVTITRLLFVLFAIAWGASILIYLVLWMVMPPAKTTAQKLQMKGEPVTLSSLEEKIKAKVPPKQEISSAAGRFLHRFAGLLREIGEGIISFIRTVLPPFLVFTGASLIVLAGLGAVLLTVLFIVMLTGTPDAWFGLPLSQFASGPVHHYLLVTSAYLLLVIPALLILLAGLALVRPKKRIPGAPSAVAMLSVWVIALLVAGIIGLRELPVYRENYNEYISGLEQHEQTYDVAAFSTVTIGGSHDVFIIPSDVHFVRAFGDEQVLNQHLRVQVTDNRLSVSNDRTCFFCSPRQARLEIGMPVPEELQLSGATRATLNSFSLDRFSLRLSGASRMDSDSDINDLSLSVSGASRATFTGDITGAEVTTSGASRVNIDHPLHSLRVRATGASLIEVGEIRQSIEADLSGGSLLEYTGDPEQSDIQAAPGSRAISR